MNTFSNIIVTLITYKSRFLVPNIPSLSFYSRL